MHDAAMLAEPMDWALLHVAPDGPAKVVRRRTWATTTRIPTEHGVVWLKECSAEHGAFEPALVAALAEASPDLLPGVIAYDAARRLLLLEDAGTSFEELGNPPERWLELLPRYAELQRRAPIASALPDRRVERWPELYEEVLRAPLPLDAAEVERLRAHAPRFFALCAELAAHGLPAAVQHDDLHHKNAFVDGERLRIIDWGDASLSHPFVSLVVTFRFLEERNGLAPDDAWLARLRDAYLEPWGTGLVPTFDLCARLGRFAHVFGWLAVRRLLPEHERLRYDKLLAIVLRRALAVA